MTQGSSKERVLSPFDTLSCIRDEIGEELLNVLSAGTWMRVAEALAKRWATPEPLPGHAAWERERMAKWISKNKPSLPDHACAQCVPGGEIVVEDFECVYHMALKIAEEAVIRDKFSAHLALTKCEGQS